MSNFNRVILAGRLTRDPELTYTQGGQALGKFSIAINDNFTDRQGQKQERAVFVDIVTWARLAENCCKFLNKGRAVLVEGRLSQRRWETETGEKRNKMEVVAMNVQFLGGRGEGSPGAPGGGEGGPGSPGGSGGGDEGGEGWDEGPRGGRGGPSGGSGRSGGAPGGAGGTGSGPGGGGGGPGARGSGRASPAAGGPPPAGPPGAGDEPAPEDYGLGPEEDYPF